MRILIVEDEERLAILTRKGLLQEGHAADIAATGEEALDWVAIASYDAIILDVMLPGMDGLAVCRTLRARRVPTPILLLTARGAVEDRVAGLDAGADDYLTKPFAFAELFARLRALSRRPAEPLDPVLTVGDLRLDPTTRRVWRGEQEHTLPNKEFRILEYLMRHPNRVLTRMMIAEHVWDYDFPNLTNVIDVHIRSLRRTIDVPYEQKRIATVRGAGYKLVGDDG
ncbi:MAG TPA: DNA-binding response regulator [Chloroflexi bacterium]|jgi:two-component system OmpR family response regulator|nr:DNA-binding response regulator [Chloroflexota bacterium]